MESGSNKYQDFYPVALGKELRSVSKSGNQQAVQEILAENRKRFDQELLEAGVNSFYLGESLESACNAGHENIVDLLIEESIRRFELSQGKKSKDQSIEPLPSELIERLIKKSDKTKPIAIKLLVYQSLFINYGLNKTENDIVQEIIPSINKMFDISQESKSESDSDQSEDEQSGIEQEPQKKQEEPITIQDPREKQRMQGLSDELVYFPPVINKNIISYIGGLENEEPELSIKEEIAKQKLLFNQSPSPNIKPVSCDAKESSQSISRS